MSYVAIITAAALVFIGDYSSWQSREIYAYQTSINRRAVSLDRLLDEVSHALVALRSTAERTLILQKKMNIESTLFGKISLSEDGKRFHLDGLGENIDRGMIGNISGMADISWKEPPLSDEIKMALNLNPFFQMLSNSLTDVSSIFYTSASGFRHYYPWFHSSEKFYYPNLLEKDFFHLSRPEQNPTGKPVWTGTYLGRTTGQLILSCSAPLFDEKCFIGVLTINIGIQHIKSFVEKMFFGGASSSMFVIARGGRIIASRDKKGDIINIGHKTFPRFMEKPMEGVLHELEKPHSPKKNAFSPIEGENHWFMASRIKNAPWALVYVLPKRDLALDAFEATGNMIIIVVLTLSLFLVIIQVLIRREFVVPARQLVSHIENESLGQKSNIRAKVSQEAWLPWFNSISDVFAENKTLIKSLETHIHTLDERVKERTKLLARKNRQLEKALSDLKVAQEQIVVQEKLASLGSLTAGIAHEMKNPLNFIVNFSEVSEELIDEIKEDLSGKVKTPEVLQTMEDLKDNLRFINDHGHRADNIIRSMLMHSRESDGNKRPTNLNDLIEESAALALSGFRGQERVSDIKLVKQFDDNIPLSNVVAEDLGRVFMNLINNSCYALIEKFKSLETKELPTIWLKTEFNAGKNHILVEVKDNGTGIPTKLRRKIFEPFYTTKPVGQGTGLGLSLSYDIVVQQNKGTMMVDSQEGEYTTFVMTFPAMGGEAELDENQDDIEDDFDDESLDSASA